MLTTHRNIRTHDDSTFHSDVKAVLSDVDAILAALELEHNQSNLHNTTTNPSTDVTRVGGGYVYNQTLLQSKPPREPLVLPRHRLPQRQIVSSFSNSPRQSHSTTTAAHHNTPNGLLTTPALASALSSKDHLGQNTVSSLSKVDFIKEFCAGGGNTPCSSPLRISPSHHRSPPKKRHQTTNDLLRKMDQITQECNETVSTIDQIQQQQQEVYHQQQEKDTRLIQQREQRDQEQRLKAEQGRAAQQKERLDKKASWIKRAWIKRAKDKLLLPSTKTVIKAVSMSTIVPKKPPRHANKKKNAKSFEDILKEITREGVVYGAPPSPRDQIMRHTGLTPRRSATPPSALKFGRKGFTSSVSSEDSDVLSGTSDDSGDEDDQFTEEDKDMMARKLPTKKSGIRRYRSTAVSSDMWADDEVIELTSDTDMTELF